MRLANIGMVFWLGCATAPVREPPRDTRTPVERLVQSCIEADTSACTMVWSSFRHEVTEAQWFAIDLARCRRHDESACRALITKCEFQVCSDADGVVAAAIETCRETKAPSAIACETLFPVLWKGAGAIAAKPAAVADLVVARCGGGDFRDRCLVHAWLYLRDDPERRTLALEAVCARTPRPSACTAMARVSLVSIARDFSGSRAPELQPVLARLDDEATQAVAAECRAGSPELCASWAVRTKGSAEAERALDDAMRAACDGGERPRCVQLAARRHSRDGAKATAAIDALLQQAWADSPVEIGGFWAERGRFDRARAPFSQACAAKMVLGCERVALLDVAQGRGSASTRALLDTACTGGDGDACVGAALLALRGIGQPSGQRAFAERIGRACDRGARRACGYLNQLEVRGFVKRSLTEPKSTGEQAFAVLTWMTGGGTLLFTPMWPRVPTAFERAGF